MRRYQIYSGKQIRFTFAAFMAAVIGMVPFPACAENYKDAPPEIQPAKANGSRILFDNTHGQTAGAADWVIDGGFSDFASALAEDGYYVTELRKDTEITYSDLKSYDVFILPEANIPYKAAEQEAILNYTRKGGSVFFIADHYNADRNKNRWDASEVFNGYRRGAFSKPTLGMSKKEANSKAMQGVEGGDWLAQHFGVRFRYNAIGDVTATQIVLPEECFEITAGVSSVAMHAGSTVAILDPSIAKGIVYLPKSLTVADKWSKAVDDGVYNGGGIKEGAYVSIAKVGQGKAAFIGDSSAAEDSTPKYKKEETGGKKTTYDGFGEEDDARLLLQLTDWLAQRESYTDFTGTSITLDKPTSLYAFEEPERSEQPEEEPWAAPAAGYQWYNAATFKAGSYGCGSDDNSKGQESYRFGLPGKITAGEELTLSIYFSGLKADTAYDGFQVGAYVNGGGQIARFVDIGGELPDTCGYSNAFSITTDKSGNAFKKMNFIIDPAVSGTFNMRLKKGKTNLITTICRVTDAAAKKPVLPKVKAFNDYINKINVKPGLMQGLQ